MKKLDSVKGLDGILKSCFHCKSVAVSLAEGKAFAFGHLSGFSAQFYASNLNPN